VKDKVLRAARIICFCIILFLIFGLIERSLIPNDIGPQRIKDVCYNIPKESLDYVSLGVSVTQWSVNPEQIEKEYGLKGWNASTVGCGLVTAYYVLDEIMKTQHPKVVTLDVIMTPGLGFRTYTDSLNLSIFKRIEIATTPNISAESTLSLIFPIFKYHDNWKGSDQSNILIKNQPDSWAAQLPMGWNGADGTNGDEVLGVFPEKKNIDISDLPINENTVVEDIDVTKVEWLKKIADRVSEGGGTLLLYLPPIYEIIEYKEHPSPIWWSQERHNAYAKLAKELNINFLDFNCKNLADEIDFNYETDLWNELHVNKIGSKKISSYLGQYIYKYINANE
jgi:hypothetical protein